MVQNAKERSSWSGKWMFILAAAASAVGLGNMWRFPYLAAKYGGGMFILTYVVLVFTFGISMLLLEIALGRKTGQSVIGAYSSFGKKYSFIGVLAAAVPFIITPYYCIIGGWVAKYATSYLVNSPAEIADGGTFFVNFITSPDSSFVFMLLFMAVVFLIVSLGVKGGIEKANLIMMPLLLVAALAIAIYVLTWPGATDGLAYYLLPDFSKFSPELLIGALGQMFYSLSLAMGIMVTYGSYLDKKESLTRSVPWIGGTDLVVSTLAGLMIVPAAFIAMGSAEAVAAKSGPSLMFITLPTVFEQMGGIAPIIGFAFFVLVLFAALTSAISLAEACVSIIADGTGWTRRKSLIVTILVVVIAGVFVNLGYNGLSFLEPLGEGSTLLDLFDFISNSVLMPIVALLTVIFVGWIVKPKVIVEEVKRSSKFRLEGVWVVMIKYVSPILLAIILVAYVGAQFGLFSI
ncbi:sodium:calcium symporter [Denitrobacterium detoxificans]|uniref:Transporter n=1 Tax=Denitrobacterium detoxificans TaxID=79604 RepID=A0A172RZJ5_9ACTN|nr:sodium-dependent transporter [Denitrobacterium detoxificans]ANE23033.1 sodium:calcium symporter [Denitrobacterium detoxificans]SEO50789.1 neurotransmitter:Na+ symporter, NSS family [Denitrobacterium detoxificans]